MTTDDDMREIEAALDEFQDASERIYQASPDPGFGDPVQQQKDARKALLALTRQKLPQTDAEHERAVEAWEAIVKEWTYDGDRYCITPGQLDEALRLMRATPVAAIEFHSFVGHARTYAELEAQEKSARDQIKAAGELLHAAKAAVQSWPSGAAEINALRDAIEAAERAGVR